MWYAIPLLVSVFTVVLGLLTSILEPDTPGAGNPPIWRDGKGAVSLTIENERFLPRMYRVGVGPGISSRPYHLSVPFLRRSERAPMNCLVWTTSSGSPAGVSFDAHFTYGAAITGAPGSAGSILRTTQVHLTRDAVNRQLSAGLTVYSSNRNNVVYFGLIPVRDERTQSLCGYQPMARGARYRPHRHTFGDVFDYFSKIFSP